MADEQVIVEIKVDDDEMLKASKNVDKLTDSIEEMTNLISSARKQNKQFKKEQQDLNKAYKDGKISTTQYEKGINTLNRKIKVNNKTIAETSIELSTQKRERSANIKLVKSEVGTLKQLEAQASVLNQTISKQSKATKEGREEYERLEKELGTVNAKVNEQRQLFKDNTKNIGNYTEGINKANFSTKDIADNLENVGGATGNAVGGIKSLGASFKALLANPIVLLIAGLVAGLSALFAAFKKSATGSRLLSKAGAALSSLFSIVVKVVEVMAQAIESAFEDPKQAVLDLWETIKKNIVQRFEGLINLVKALGSVIKSALTLNLEELQAAAGKAGDALLQIGTGLTPEELQAVGNAMSEAAQEAANFAKAMVQLNENQFQLRQNARGLEKDIAVLTAELEVLNETLGDDTQSMQDMNKAAFEAIEVAIKLAAKEEELAKRKLSIINQEVALRRSAGEDIQDLLDAQVQAEIELINARSKSAIEQQKIAIEQRKIERDIFEQNLDIFLDIGDKLKTQRDKDIDDETKTIDERRKLLESSRIAQKANLKLQLDEFQRFGKTNAELEEIIRSEDAKTANEKLKNLGISEIAVNRLREIILERKQVELDFAEQQKALSQEEADRRKAAVTTIKDLENEKNKFLIEQQIAQLGNEKETANQRIEFQKQLAEQLIAFEKAKLETLLTNETLTAEERKALALETEIAILQIEDEFAVLRDEKEIENKELQAEKDAENIDRIKENFATISEITAEFAGEEFTIFGTLTDNIASLFQESSIDASNALMAIGATAKAVFASVNAGRNEQLERFKILKDAELQKAGDNEAQKARVEKVFREAENKVKLKQFRAEKASALLQIGIQTALAVIKTIGNLGLPAAIPFAIAVAALGAIQFGIVAAKQPPKFAKGTSDIVNIGGSHASGNDVTVVGYDSSGNSQLFGKVEKGEAMPVIRKSAVNEYLVSSLNSKYSGISTRKNRTFQGGTADIIDTGTEQTQQQFPTAQALADALSNVNIVTKIEDITEAATKKTEIIDNSLV